MSEVDHPKHYNSHPFGVEAIDICEGFNFNIGNAVKYLWRQGLKGDSIVDLEKAAWYVQREIARRKAEALKTCRNCGAGKCSCHLAQKAPKK